MAINGDESKGKFRVGVTEDSSEEDSGVLVRNFNVWARDADGNETQISTNGFENHLL
jgi:hypothetical protein